MKSVAFIYWGPHEAHAAWAKSITNDFYPFIPSSIFKKFFNPEDTFTDFFKKTFVHQPLSIINSINIPKVDIYLIEGMGCILPALLKKKKDSRIILINDDTFFYDYKKSSPSAKAVYNKLIKKVNGIISTSKYVNDLIPPWIAVPKKIVPLYADTKKFSKVSINLTQKTIGFVGRLGYKKGIDILIDVYEKIRKNDPNYKLYLVGNIYDSSIRNKFKKTRAKEDIILTNWVDNPEAYLVLAS